MGQLYKDILKREGVDLTEKGNNPEATAKGSYRKLIQKAYNLSWGMVSNEETNAPNSKAADPVVNCARFQFDLRSGCYATMLLRELMLTTMVRDLRIEG